MCRPGEEQGQGRGRADPEGLAGQADREGFARRGHVGPVGLNIKCIISCNNRIRSSVTTSIVRFSFSKIWQWPCFDHFHPCCISNISFHLFEKK